jgi:hypothetical protein
MALLHTRDQVVRSLDSHLAELHGLRQALAQVEQQAQVVQHVAAPPVSVPLPPPVPQPVPMVQPVAIYDDPPAPPPPMPQPPEPVLAALQGLQEALLHKAPVTPAPMPMAEVFPDRLPDFSEQLVAQPFALPPMQSMTHLPSRPLVAPSMPQQTMSFQTAFTTVAPELVPAPAAQPVAAPASMPLSRPLVAKRPSLPLLPLTTLPPPSLEVQRQHTPLPPPREIAREVVADPRMAQATLEDLNAALAFAFSHASQPSRPLQPESMAVASRPLAQPQQQWSLPPRA